ncbi:hypothetical protein [Mycolicibacterium celeriflavum]|uniref:hypothetical protein n=1 Tax=Mycolicibacterium celeriflavum TaxID=1249101 RepID=UPI003CF2FA3E
MADVNARVYDTDLLDARAARSMVGAGAMCTRLHTANPTFDNLAVLNETCASVTEAKYVRLQVG